jgi:hypothetical protein
MAYSQSPINFGVGTGSSPLNRTIKSQIEQDKEKAPIGATKGEDTTESDSGHTTYGTTYYNEDGSRVQGDVDHQNVSKPMKGKDGRRFVMKGSKKLYLSAN